MSSCKPISGQFPDRCGNDTFASTCRFHCVALLLVSFGDVSTVLVYARSCSIVWSSWSTSKGFATPVR
jgi:hypothetical protein